jgi:hypothetical protein
MINCNVSVIARQKKKNPPLTIISYINMIKDIRNNFLYKNLIWNNDEGTCTAKWKHVENDYVIDGWIGEFSAMPKLTDQHVIPAKINKMKVAFCTHYSVIQLQPRCA